MDIHAPWLQDKRKHQSPKIQGTVLGAILTLRCSSANAVPEPPVTNTELPSVVQLLSTPNSSMHIQSKGSMLTSNSPQRTTLEPCHRIRLCRKECAAHVPLARRYRTPRQNTIMLPANCTVVLEENILLTVSCWDKNGGCDKRRKQQPTKLDHNIHLSQSRISLMLALWEVHGAVHSA